MASSGSPALILDAGAARGRGQDQRRVLRGLRQCRNRRPRARPRAHPGRRAVHRRRQARRHQHDRRAPGRGDPRRPGRGRGDAQPVPGPRRNIGPARARGPLRLRAVPHVEPGRGRAPGPGRGRRAAVPGTSPARSPTGRQIARNVGLVVGATAPSELAQVRAGGTDAALPRARAWARRAATSTPCWRSARRHQGPRRHVTRRSAAGQRVARHRRRPPAFGLAIPEAALAAAAASWATHPPVLG